MLLKDNEFVKKVKDIIATCTGKYTDLEDKGLIWDTSKCEIRGMSVKYSKRKDSSNREHDQSLQKE